MLTAEHRSVLRRILRYQRGVAGALALSLLQTAVAIVPVLAAKLLIDRLTRHALHFSSLLFPIGAAIGSAILAALAGIAVA